MKRDLFIVASLILLAIMGAGGVYTWQALQPEDDGKTTIKPKPAPLAAAVPKKEEPKNAPSKREPVQVALTSKKKEERPGPIPKKVEPVPKVDESKEAKEPKDIVPAKKKDEIPPQKPLEVKVDPKAEVKVAANKDEKRRPKTKFIAIDNQIQLNDPEGEFTVDTINRGKTIILAGTVKVLKVAGLNEQSTLDARELDAGAIVFLGNVNSGSRVLLGKSQSLIVRDVNDRSLIDGSLLAAKEIEVAGNINGGSAVKLDAPDGAIKLLGDINGEGKLTMVANHVELRGSANGAQTQIDLTLTKNGSLKVRRLTGGVIFSYRRADASDPPPRIERGDVDARAELREVPPARK